MSISQTIILIKEIFRYEPFHVKTFIFLLSLTAVISAFSIKSKLSPPLWTLLVKMSSVVTSVCKSSRFETKTQKENVRSLSKSNPRQGINSPSSRISSMYISRLLCGASLNSSSSSAAVLGPASSKYCPLRSGQSRPIITQYARQSTEFVTARRSLYLQKTETCIEIKAMIGR